MLEIQTSRVSPTLRALFPTDVPQARRCFAVLDNTGHAGRILTDDRAHPTWGAAREAYEGTVFLAGIVDAAIVADIFAEFRRDGETLVCLWPDDPRLSLLPPDPYYEGWVLEFHDRPAGQGLDAYIRQLPPECELRRLDRDLILRTRWGPDDVRFAGGIQAWKQTCMGYCLLCDDEILCESTAGPPAIGLHEPGVITHEDHRGKGYATMTSARLIQEIEAHGGRTYWTCTKQNVASIAVARKLGYRLEKECRCLAWQQTG